jgi:hypothetical protein
MYTTEILDPDACLSAETYQWCFAQLQQSDFQLPIVREPFSNENYGVSTHFQAYCFMRTKISAHAEAGLAPTLRIASSPTGSYDWIVRAEIQRNNDPEMAVNLYAYDNESVADLDEQIQPDASNDLEF